MTETAWLACADPATMLSSLADRASPRKLRLFAAACCRRLLRLQFPIEPELRILERFADGQAGTEELARVGACGRYKWDQDIDNNDGAVNYFVCSALEDAAAQEFDAEVARCAALAVAWHASRVVLGRQRSMPEGMRPGPDVILVDDGCPQCRLNIVNRCYDESAEAAFAEERRYQCAVLRDIFGDAFRAAPAAEACPSWQDGTVRNMAWSIYEERAFERLPILADALEDAGCGDEQLLAHCRQGGEHVRGCWAVDRVLGRV